MKKIRDWFNALLSSMGLFGLFIGAFVAGLYCDRFGRKNSMIVWNAACCFILLAHTFMPEKFSFMIMRTLGQASHVSCFHS